MSELILLKKDAIIFGWQKTRSNIVFWLQLMLIVAVIFFIPSYVSELLANKSAALSFIFLIAAWVLQIGIALGLIGVALKFNDGANPSLTELFNYLEYFWSYFLASLLYGLIIFVGVILFVVPAFIWGIKYSLFPYFIVDKKVKPLVALQMSAQVTVNIKWQLFIFMCLLALINTAGVLFFGLGLFVTVPVTYLAWCHVYRQLSTRQINLGQSTAK